MENFQRRFRQKSWKKYFCISIFSSNVIFIFIVFIIYVVINMVMMRVVMIVIMIMMIVRTPMMVVMIMAPTRIDRAVTFHRLFIQDLTG